MGGLGHGGFAGFEGEGIVVDGGDHVADSDRPFVVFAGDAGHDVLAVA